MSSERPWNAQDKAKWLELDRMAPADLVKRCFDSECKLGASVELEYFPEHDEWRAHYRDHHAIGRTVGRAIFELGLYMIRDVEPPP